MKGITMTGELTEAQASAVQEVEAMYKPENQIAIRALAEGYVSHDQSNRNYEEWIQLVGPDIFCDFYSGTLRTKLGLGAKENVQMEIYALREQDIVPFDLLQAYGSAANAARQYRMMNLSSLINSNDGEEIFANQVECEWRAATLARALLAFLPEDA